MKLVKTRLRNCLGDKTLDMLMKISNEGPKTLEDEKLYRIKETKTKKTSCLNCYYGDGLGEEFIVLGGGGEASSVPPPPP